MSQTAKIALAALGGIGRRPVAASDQDFLLKVYASTRDEEMALVPWSESQKTAFLKSQLRAQRLSYEANHPDAAHDIIFLDGRPIGQIWVGRSEEEIRLLDIAILPEHRGRGVGTALLKELQDEAARRAKPMRHCVFKTNQAALAFYARLGFQTTDDIGLYYLMEWSHRDREPENTVR